MITASREWHVGTVAPHRHWWRDPRLLVPLGAGAIYLLVLTLRLPSVLSSFYWYGDFPAALRLGDAVFHGGWGQGLQLRDQAGLGPLWVVGLLNQFTGNAVASMALGASMTMAAVGLMVATARRVMDMPATLLVGVLCIAAPPVVAWEALSPLAHETTLLITAVGAWQLVDLARPRVSRGIACAILVGVLAGVCAVSDSLAFAAAIAPWAICATVLARRNPNTRAPLLITVCVAIVSALAIDVLAHASGIMVSSVTVPGLSVQGVAAGLDVAASTLGEMISGAWYSDTLPSVITIGAFLLFSVVMYLALTRVIRRPAHSFASRETYLLFWVMSSAGIIAALCVTGLGIQTSPVNYQGHYLNGLWFATAALLPLAVMGKHVSGRWVVGVVTALALVSAVGIIRLTAFPFEGPDYRDGPLLTATLTQLGVARGYGGYWESYSIGWHTDQRITALPLQSCTNATGAVRLCRYQYAAPASYVAEPGSVFVIVLRGSCRNDDLCIDAENLVGLPSPVAVRTVGLLQIYVYSKDIFAGLPEG